LEPFLIHAEMGMKYNKQPHDIKYERGLNKKPWSTADEMQWIKTLGTHNEHINNPPYDDLLRRYLEATKKRKTWDRIDKRAVIAYAKKQLLKQEMANIAT